jgi:hypothetical protein
MSFAMRVRVRPWSERDSRSSSGRVGDLDLDRLRDGEVQLALGALDGDGSAVDRDLDTRGDLDGKTSDS